MSLAKACLGMCIPAGSGWLQGWAGGEEGGETALSSLLKFAASAKQNVGRGKTQEPIVLQMPAYPFLCFRLEAGRQLVFPTSLKSETLSCSENYVQL